MASKSKRKTTMAKLNRERRLLERRQEKQAKKLARKQVSADQPDRPSDTPPGEAAAKGTQEGTTSRGGST